MPKKRIEYGYKNLKVHYLKEGGGLLCLGKANFPTKTENKDEVTCTTCAGILKRGYNTRLRQSEYTKNGRGDVNR